MMSGGEMNVIGRDSQREIAEDDCSGVAKTSHLSYENATKTNSDLCNHPSASRNHH